MRTYVIETEFDKKGQILSIAKDCPISCHCVKRKGLRGDDYNQIETCPHLYKEGQRCVICKHKEE